VDHTTIEESAGGYASVLEELMTTSLSLLIMCLSSAYDELRMNWDWMQEYLASQMVIGRVFARLIGHNLDRSLACVRPADGHDYWRCCCDYFSGMQITIL
jgi:hypothetical protein